MLGEGEGIPLKVVDIQNILGCEEPHSRALVASSCVEEGSQRWVASTPVADHGHCNWGVWVADTPYAGAHRMALGMNNEVWAVDIQHVGAGIHA